MGSDTNKPTINGTRVYRICEFVVLFVALPVGLVESGYRVPILPALWLLTAVCIVLLRIDPSFDDSRLWRRGDMRRHMRRIAARFMLCAALVTLAVVMIDPASLFGFVRRRPWLWLVIMCLYPLLSAYPQGIIYRAFIFHRYRRVFRDPRAVLLASAGAFSLTHVVLENWIAVALTFVGGLMFADTYRRSASLPLSVLEHAMYGCFMFTVGLGSFFYGGAR